MRFHRRSFLFSGAVGFLVIKRRSARTLTVVVLIGAGCSSSSIATQKIDSRNVYDQIKGDPVALQIEIERRVADCMKRKGWTYSPTPVTSPPAVIADTVFATTYGYGISTNPPAPASGVSSPENDPNTKIVNALATADQTAYSTDLIGTPAAPGCRIAARRAAITKMEPALTPSGQTLVTDFQKAVEADPTVIQAHKDWTACMRRAGFAIDTTVSGVNHITDRLRALPVDDTAALAALQHDEIAMASADYACTTTTLLPARRKVEAAHSGELLQALNAIAQTAVAP